MALFASQLSRSSTLLLAAWWLFGSNSTGMAIGAVNGTTRFVSAAEVHDLLRSSDKPSQLAGRHYVMGVVDTLQLLKDQRVCIGANVPIAEIEVLLSEQFERRPDIRRFNASSVIREVLATQFPCT